MVANCGQQDESAKQQNQSVAGFVSASQLAPTTVSQPLIPTPTATAMTPQASAVGNCLLHSQVFISNC
jgi:hypothetical protein